MRLNRWSVLGITLFTVVWSLPARAADDASALSQVPADTPVVLHVRGLERTKERLTALIKNAVPDFAGLAQAAIDGGIESALMGRELKGLPKDGSIFALITELPPKEEQSVAFLIQVSDYNQFRDGILKEAERKAIKKGPDGIEETKVEGGQAVYFFNRKGYAFVTPSKELAAKFSKTSPGLDSRLPKNLAKIFMENDASIYVNMETVNKQFAAQIKDLRKQIDAVMEQAGGAGADKSTMEMAKRFLVPVFQAVEDSRAVVAAVDLRPDGVALQLHAGLAEGSKTQALLKDAQPAKLEGLGKLPAGKLGYVGTRLSKELAKSFLPMMYGVLVDPDSPEGKKFQQAIMQLQNADPTVSYGTFSLPISGLTVTQYANPNMAAEAQLKLFQSTSAGGIFQSGVIKGEPKVKPNAENYRGYKLTSASITWDIEKMMAGQAGAGQIPKEMQDKMVEGMKKMMGEQMNIWFGSDGKNYVQVTAANWDAAKKMLDAYLDAKSTVGGQKGYEDARKNLPAEANVIFLVDLPRYAEAIFGFVQTILPPGVGLPPNIPAPMAPKGKFSYMGMAVVLQNNVGGGELWIPVTAVQDLREMFQPLIQQLMGR